MILRPLPPAAGAIVMMLALPAPALAAPPSGGTTLDPRPGVPRARAAGGRARREGRRAPQPAGLLLRRAAQRRHVPLPPRARRGRLREPRDLRTGRPRLHARRPADDTGLLGLRALHPRGRPGRDLQPARHRPRGVRGAQRYHLQVGRALDRRHRARPGHQRTSPGSAGDSTASASTSSTSTASRSTRRGEVRLRVEAPTELGLSIRDHRGTVVAGDDGSGQVRRTLRPGRYYAAVLAFANQQVRYTLTRLR